MLQDQSNNSNWTKVLHPPHVGPAPDPHHGPGHPEQRDHEHLDGLPGQGERRQEAGEGSHGDRPLHPKHPGGEGRGGTLHLHQPVILCYSSSEETKQVQMLKTFKQAGKA